MSIPLDWDVVRSWLAFVVRGLAWHHWGVLITKDCAVDVMALSARGDLFFERLRRMRAAARMKQDLGGGTFSYEAAQGVDNPRVSVWTFSIYGGATLAGDPTQPGQGASRIGVLVGPKSVFDRADRRRVHGGAGLPA